MKPRKLKEPPPKGRQVTPLYRARLSCKVGRDALDGKPMPDGLSDHQGRLIFALHSLIHAVEDIALALEQKWAEAADEVEDDGK